MASKYHWLKLPDNFFKRHDIKIIKQMDNGDKYVIFYQQLLLESISHDGELRFSELIPYDEKMLSIITDTDIDIVRSAMKILTELGMVQILDDATIFMTNIQRMIGRDDGAERVRRHREKVKLLEESDVTNCNVTVTLPSNSISNSNSNSNIPNDINTNIPNDTIPPKPKKEHKAKVPKPPKSFSDVEEYAKERGVPHLAKGFWDYYGAGDWYDGKGEPVLAWKQKFVTWQQREEKKNGSSTAHLFEKAVNRNTEDDFFFVED